MPAGSRADDRPIREIPALAKAPKLDGILGDLAAGRTIQPTNHSQASSFSAKVAFQGETLFLGVTIHDPRVQAGDLLTVGLHFPDAGTTARGYSYRFAFDGRRDPDPESGPPAFANRLVRAVVRKMDSGMVLEAAFPARSLPRFPTQGAMLLELCLTYQDAISNCTAGVMTGEALRLPDAFRKNLNLHPPQEVVGLEGREHGWVGFGLLHYPAWVSADREITPQVLRSSLLEDIRDPIQYRISLPPRMSLPDGRILLSVLTGNDPFKENAPCNPQHQLRIGLFLVQGRTARRALELPGVSCALGRASSVVLEGDGALTIGYSNGSIASYAWTGDHFERTEIG